MRHYHVLSGMHGYMPDRNEVYRHKKDAQEDARWFRRTLTENGERIRIFGSAEKGWYEIDSDDVGKAGVQYIEIVECQEDDCLEVWEEVA